MKDIEFSIKGNALKRKFSKEPNLKLWTLEICEDKTYIPSRDLSDMGWYRIRKVGNELQVAEIQFNRKMPKYMVYDFVI